MLMTPKISRPMLLIVLDGWGYREETQANAIAAAKIPHWDHWWKTYPHTLMEVSGHSVGLPAGQMGNSEVGHLNMGAGRIVHQDLTRIDLAIESGEFFRNAVLVENLQNVKQANRALHILGLVSPGGVHSHERHIHAVIEMAAQLKLPTVYLHAFLDGRDTPPRSALSSLEQLNAHLQRLHCGQIVSLIGRYYAMDRDKRWERVQKAYELIALGKGDYEARTAEEGLALAYARGENDEFVHSTSIHPPDEAPPKVQDGDLMLFMNFRADRARELTQAFIDPNFNEFKIEPPKPKITFISLTQYNKNFPIAAAFPPQQLTHLLAQCISERGLKQLRIAETEKYAHVTFFFNGGVEKPYPLEERILIPSSKVATYDLHPEMSANQLTERLVNEITTEKFDLIVCNFANPDMVGHTGNFDATVKAIETIDACLGKIINALQKVGGEAIITADHGNAEQMFDNKTNQPHTAHTSNLVPVLYIGNKGKMTTEIAKLSDIAPTILYLMNIQKPKEMTGLSLINRP